MTTRSARYSFRVTHRRWALALLASTLLLSGCAVLGAPPGERTFYVSPTGDDAARGTSPGTAWRTLDRASAAHLFPGERLLLEGGAHFPGRLLIDAGDAGDPARPVVVGSYGTGRAVIDAPADAAVAVVDTSGVEITDLLLAGPETVQPGSAGVRFYNDRTDRRVLAHAVVRDVEASGFVNGVEIGAKRTGFADVLVADCALHDNRDAGLAVYGPAFDAAAPAYAHHRVTVERVRAWNNHGDPGEKARNTGSGIVLGSVDGALVTGSVAHDNGGLGAAGEGPEGIWAYDATGVVIEHSLAYRNRTAHLTDGGGFGLDQNASNSVLQYNLSYDNDGPGYLVYTGQDNAAHTGSTVRWNVSSGDARRWDVYGGITVLGRVADVRIYQNTVVMAPQERDPSAALRLGPGISGVRVRNNVLFSDGAGPAVAAEHAFPASAAELSGNAYRAPRPLVRWGAGSYATLAAFRAGTGQERGTGIDAEPRLRGPLTALAATAPDDAAALAGFAPGPGSPLRRAGLGLAGFAPVGVDPADPPGPTDVGAVQVSSRG